MITNKRREYIRKYQREWMSRRRQEFFQDKFCVDCGSVEKLELHHIDYTQKEHHAIWSWREERRLAEIEKCQVLCKPCHLEKTKEELKIRFPQIHGTQASYVRGCKCRECLIAHNKSTNEWAKNNRLKKKQDMPS